MQQLHVNGELHAGAKAAYDHLVARFVARFGASKQRAARDLWSTLDATAREELALQGHVPHEAARVLRESVARDLAQIASVLVRGTPDDARAIARLAAQRGSLRLLLEALRLSGDAVFRVAGASGAAELRRAGEATCAGSLRCLGCGAVQRSTQALVAAPCAECGSAEFAKHLRV